MTTFEWMDPQTTGILFLWAPVGAKKLGVRFESRSAVGVSFSTSNTLAKFFFILLSLTFKGLGSGLWAGSWPQTCQFTKIL